MGLKQRTKQVADTGAELLPFALKILARIPSRRVSVVLSRGLVAGVKRAGRPVYSGTGEVFFLYHAEGGEHQVVLAADWTGWQPSITLERCGVSPLYSARVPLASDTWAGYKLIVDGVWTFDPLNPFRVAAGNVGQNSLLQLPHFRQPPQVLLPPGAPRGRLVDQGRMQGEGLPGGRRVRVWLPPDYDQGTRRYPTLYIQDGEENFERGRLPETLDAMVAAGLPPVIAVFVDHPGAERHLDYTPFFEGSRVQAYAAWMATRLVPWVDSQLRTEPSAHRRILLGHSFGATCVLVVAHTYPEVFARVAAQSGVYVWEGANTVVDLYRRQPPEGLRYYLDHTRFGREAAQSGRMAEVLHEKGLDFTCLPRGTNHSYEGWRFWLPDIFIKLIGA